MAVVSTCHQFGLICHEGISFKAAKRYFYLMTERQGILIENDHERKRVDPGPLLNWN
jgi:hypothetical protein